MNLDAATNDQQYDLGYDDGVRDARNGNRWPGADYGQTDPYSEGYRTGHRDATTGKV